MSSINNHFDFVRCSDLHTTGCQYAVVTTLFTVAGLLTKLRSQPGQKVLGLTLGAGSRSLTESISTSIFEYSYLALYYTYYEFYVNIK